MIKRDNLPWQPASAAVVEWCDDGSPRSPAFGDIYYSRDNGLEESRYVFLQGNVLPKRWQTHGAQSFCIAETGFGTGLNFLLTWQAWLATPAPRPDLHYLSVEKYPLAKADLARALAAWPSLASLASQLLEQYPSLIRGQHRLLLAQGKLTLDLWWEDVSEALPDLASHNSAMVDAWYLDGFAPDRNAAMWQPAVLDAVTSLSRVGASFSTFTAAGQVRRQLVEAGFTVAKVPGYGRKRECLRGQLTRASPPRAANSSWDLPATPPKRPEQALVIGAGLAGCCAAAALARRGIHVTLLEQQQLAGEGSGNEQGILYTRLSREHSSLTDFSLQSYRFSTAFYRELFARGALSENVDGALCGSFHQSDKTGEMAVLAELLSAVPELASVLDPGQASALLGIEQPAAGYWFPQSGWLRPAAVCRALVSHERIHLIENCGAIGLEATQHGWLASAGTGQTWEAPCTIVAAGVASASMPELDWLPLQIIRGQTTQLPTAAPFNALRAALCHEGYIAPARAGVHCIGATFNLQDDEQGLRAEDHRYNLAGLARAVPVWRDALTRLHPASMDGRVGFRCASPDYLPMVGPVPDLPTFLRDFGPLRRNARQVITARGQYLPGLYLSTAHGSRGLTSTPLAAELLASQICGEPPPLCREMIRTLAPARFIIRDLRRNRI